MGVHVIGEATSQIFLGTNIPGSAIVQQTSPAALSSNKLAPGRRNLMAQPGEAGHHKAKSAQEDVFLGCTPAKSWGFDVKWGIRMEAGRKPDGGWTEAGRRLDGNRTEAEGYSDYADGGHEIARGLSRGVECIATGIAHQSFKRNSTDFSSAGEIFPPHFASTSSDFLEPNPNGRRVRDIERC
ncbi:hypothetical protein B0H10DRAFT_1959902 [Mycena sp. CBHHK59/15]|nr:hypothetical protein B0H10DRAFT_1959902 [Mycena sp. CBHHK59/15]